MSDFFIHVTYALIFCIFLLIGMLIWDFDHLVTCKSNLLAKAIMPPAEGYQAIEETNPECKRGIAHSFGFFIGFLALFIGFLLHMWMDYVTVR